LIARFRTDLATAAGAAFDGTMPIALAVSGGGDSMALLALTHVAFPGCAHVATVDHGLRQEAAAEAQLVADWCDDHDIPHITLRPCDPLPPSSVQAGARQIRYAALEHWAVESGISLLATAHHADDQAETFIMRGNRGSGLSGMAAIRRRRTALVGVDGEGTRPVRLTIVRPLLRWRRVTLAALTAAAGITPAADPSNVDDRYDRARLRKALSAADWLDPVAIGRSVDALADAEEALLWSVAHLWEERVVVGEGGVRLDVADLPFELVRRLALAALAQVDPAAPPPRGPALVRFCTALAAGTSAMLGTILAVPNGPIWYFRPAPPRRAH
jgi:tRNA(Ile)-lysidine synthase